MRCVTLAVDTRRKAGAEDGIAAKPTAERRAASASMLLDRCA